MLVATRAMRARASRAIGELASGSAGKHAAPAPRQRRFEQLEQRALMAVSMDGGWTVVEPSTDSRVIYVSNASGSDGNDGLTPETAKKSVSAGVALLRDGSADHLLLKRGDTFTNQDLSGLPDGRSADEPTYIGAYGNGERPKLLTGGGSGFVDNGGINFLVIQGLYFAPHTRNAGDNPSGLQVRGACESILIEDCYVGGYKDNVLIGSGASNISDVQVRRNVIVDSWSTSAHAQGIFANGVHGFLIEENVLDHNGWNPEFGAEATIYNHNMYLTHKNTDVTVRGNISSRGSSMGLKLQPLTGSHEVDDNLFVRNGYAAQLGGGKAQKNPPIVGINLTATNNVFTEGQNNGASNAIGVTISNVNAGSFSGNIIANKNGPGNKGALSLQDGVSGWESQGYGVRDFTVDGNVIYNWRGSANIARPTEGDPRPVIENVTFSNNRFQEPNSDGSPLVNTYTANPDVVEFTGNTYHTSEPDGQWFAVGGDNQSYSQFVNATGEDGSARTDTTFFDPTRTTVTYAATLGLTSFEELMSEARAQSRSNWRTELTAGAINDYMRAGFKVDAVGVAPLPTPILGIPPEGASPQGFVADGDVDSGGAASGPTAPTAPTLVAPQAWNPIVGLLNSADLARMPALDAVFGLASDAEFETHLGVDGEEAEEAANFDWFAAGESANDDVFAWLAQ